MERRSATRHNVALFVRMEDAAGKSLRGTISDISRGGMRVHTTGSFEPGTEVTFEATLFSGTCLVIRAASRLGTVVLGLQFTAMTDASRVALSDLLMALEREDRMYG